MRRVDHPRRLWKRLLNVDRRDVVRDVERERDVDVVRDVERDGDVDVERDFVRDGDVDVERDFVRDGDVDVERDFVRDFVRDVFCESNLNVIPIRLNRGNTPKITPRSFASIRICVGFRVFSLTSHQRVICGDI